MFPASDDEARATPTRHEREPFLPLTLATLAAPLLWALHFAFVYLLEGFLCTPPIAGAAAIQAAAAIPAAILIATIIGGGLCAWSLGTREDWPRRGRAAALQSHTFVNAFRRLLAGLALIAIVWGGTGALLLSPCSFAY